LANNNDNFYSLESGPIFSKNYLNVLSQIQSLKFMIKKKSVIFNIPTLQNLISTLPNYYCLSVILFLLMKNFKIHYFIIYFFLIFLNLKKNLIIATSKNLILIFINASNDTIQILKWLHPPHWCYYFFVVSKYKYIRL
jgi:hypothetical protein